VSTSDPLLGGPQSVRRKRRTSDRLTDRERSDIRAATDFAVKLGVPLNRFITINWSTAGVEDGFGATQAS